MIWLWQTTTLWHLYVPDAVANVNANDIEIAVLRFNCWNRRAALAPQRWAIVLPQSVELAIGHTQWRQWQWRRWAVANRNVIVLVRRCGQSSKLPMFDFPTHAHLHFFLCAGVRKNDHSRAISIYFTGKLRSHLNINNRNWCGSFHRMVCFPEISVAPSSALCDISGQKTYMVSKDAHI